MDQGNCRDYVHGRVETPDTKAPTIEAEDALLAALKIKLENPEALITYVRKSNRRGDRRHPHEALQNKEVAQLTSRLQPMCMERAPE